MKKIIIVGATSGIGRGLAEAYSQEDYLIGITGRRENLLKEVCTQDKDKLFYQVCDITDTQAAISSLETLTQKMGGMDILIICAGTGELNPELSYQLEEPRQETAQTVAQCLQRNRLYQHRRLGIPIFRTAKKRASGYYFLCWRYTRQWHRSRLQCVESLSNQLYGRITTKSN